MVRRASRRQPKHALRRSAVNVPKFNDWTGRSAVM
jgi:hypothetical protein